MNPLHFAGAGLGFRRELIPALKAHVPDAIDFFEIAPENWIDLGGLPGRELRSFTERYPFVCHGLCWASRCTNKPALDAPYIGCGLLLWGV